MGAGAAGGDSARDLDGRDDGGDPLEVDGLRLCSFLPGELKTGPNASALTPRAKPVVALEARLDVVEADQRLRFRRVSLKPPRLLEREWPRLCLESTSLAESGILGAGLGLLNRSVSSGAAACGAAGSPAILAGGKRDAVRWELAAPARDDDRGGFGRKAVGGAAAGCTGCG
jgi:hypothetical protein